MGRMSSAVSPSTSDITNSSKQSQKPVDISFHKLALISKWTPTLHRSTSPESAGGGQRKEWRWSRATGKT
jgi:hypothetical protein